MSNLSALDSLELEGLNDKGKPVKERLKNVQSALGIFSTLLKADEQSAVNRSRIDAMFDGDAPYKESQLKASGQSLKTNLNFGEGQRLLDISLSAYVDLYSSLEKLVEVCSTGYERSESIEKESIVAEELTNMFRRWPEFHSSYLRLCTQFIKHGVGIAYFDSPEDWKFRVGGFADILIPRQTPASEEAIDVAVGRRHYQLHELYNFIKNEDVASKVGWNVKEVKRVMVENVRTNGREWSDISNYEQLQAEIKNNDIYTGIQNPTVEVLHFWVRELNGSVSHYISAKDSPKDFLYKKTSKYSAPEQAYIFFTYGVGSNGTYHSIRGLGQRIFAHVQTSNRLRCQQIDGAMLASAVMIQPENQRSLDELSFTFYGAYAVMSPDVNIVEKAIPNLGTAVQPALQDLSQQLALNTDTISPYGPEQTSPYKNKMQVVADMDVATRISGSTLNLFYASWSRLMREMVRRVLQTKTTDGAVADFYRRCANRGVDKAFIKSIDLDKTKAVRSVGDGSAANRLVALRELQGVSGQFDETGRRNLTRDIVSTRVGHDLVNRYVPPEQDERQPVDAKIAYMENGQLANGQQVPVLSEEMHGAHLQMHLPMLQELIEAVNTGQIEPERALPALQAFYQHVAETAQFASADPALDSMVSQAQQLLQFTEEHLNNTMKALEKQQRDSDTGNTVQDGQAEEAEEALKIRRAEVEMQITQQKAQLEMALKKEKFDQEQALRDAKAALDFRIDSQKKAVNHPLPERTPYKSVGIRKQ